MTKHLSLPWMALAFFLAILLAGCSKPAGTQITPPPDGKELAVQASFTGGDEGGWDYLTVDPVARRVYAAHATKVLVFDADKGALLGEVADTPGVHGIALVPELNLGFATNGKEGAISVFDLKTFKTLKKIPAGQKPDAILFEPVTKKIYAFNHGSGDITIVDPASLEKAPQTLNIGGTLEFGVEDGKGHVYVNVEDKGEVVEIDARSQQIAARWSVAPGESPTGLAIDAGRRRLFVGCGNQKLIILDTGKGLLQGVLPVGKGVDGVAFDPGSGIVVTSNGRDGTLTAAKEGEGGQFAVIQTLPTVKGARTVTSDPKTRRFFLPCMVKDANDKETFGLLVVGKAEN